MTNSLAEYSFPHSFSYGHLSDQPSAPDGHSHHHLFTGSVSVHNKGWPLLITGERGRTVTVKLLPRLLEAEY